MFLSALILRAASGEGSKVGGDHVAWLVSQHASSSFLVTMAFDEANRFESVVGNTCRNVSITFIDGLHAHRCYWSRDIFRLVL